MITGRPKKEPAEKVIRLSISFSPRAYEALAYLARSTKLSKAQICSWAVIHLLKEIEDEGISAEE